MVARLLSLALAMLAACAAWLTLGLQAVVDGTTRSRLGVLPPWWLLAMFVAAFSAVVWARRLAPSRLWPLILTGLVCLPWVPGSIPAAFLIWYGPLTVAVWGLTVLGLVAPELGRLAPADMLRNPRRAPWLLGAVTLVLFVAGAWTLRARLPGGDEPHYLIITQSLLADGDLRIEDNHAEGDYLGYHADELKPDYLQRGLNGQIYSIHTPGVSALVAPAFAVAGWPGASLFMSVLAALTAMSIWRVAWRLTGGDAGAAWLAATAFAFTGPGYFHAFTIFPDGAGALCAAVAVWALIRLELAMPLSRASLALAGSALALLPWLHTRFAVLAGGFGLILLLRLWRRDDRLRAAGTLLAVPVVSAAGWFAFFWVIWGTPNPAAPYGQATQSAWVHLKPAIPGLLFDQQFGLITTAPIYAVALAGFLALGRSNPRLALELATLCAAYVLAVGTYRMWWGGYSAPARFLVAMLPALMPPLAVSWARASASARAFMLVLLTISVALLVPRVFVDGGSLAYNDRDGADLLLDWLNRSVNLPMALPSLHRDVVADAWRDIGIWVGIGLVTCAGAAAIASRVGQAWTWMSAAVAAATMLAASFVWRVPDASTTQNTSALALLQQWPSRPHGSGWQSSPLGFAAAEAIPARLLIGSTNRGARPGRNAPLLNVSYVPAGRYQIVVGGAHPEGRLTLTVGRAAQALEVIDLAVPAGDRGLSVALPAEALSLTIQGDDRARATVTALALRPETVGSASGAPPLLARRASRYGTWRVFFFDDNAFMEPAGFWTRGASVAEVFVDAAGTSPDPPTALLVRAGPVASTVVLSSGAWRQVVSLPPGESTAVTLPAGRTDGWAVRLETSSGFRPSQHDTASKDLRNLGVWVETAP